jgi:hypothetical protein
MVTYPYTESSNVFTFGLILWEVMTLKNLYDRPREYAGKVTIRTVQDRRSGDQENRGD